MTQSERLFYLIEYLKAEDPRYDKLAVPEDESARFDLFRSLVNVRMPAPIGQDFLEVQDAYLQNEIRVFDSDTLEFKDDIALWQGDITTLRCDAIVNAANSRMLGCFCPCHACIDNCIHTFAGVQLRLACDAIMQKQGHFEKTGDAKITPAFNSPSKYVLHTVGPIVQGEVTAQDRAQLADCYTACLTIAEENHCESVAFCCISTGEFHFPKAEAAHIAVETVKRYKAQNNSKIKVIFNVFQSVDHDLYKTLLGLDRRV